MPKQIYSFNIPFLGKHTSSVVLNFSRRIKRLKLVSCISNVLGGDRLVLTSNIQGLQALGYAQENTNASFEIDYENPITLQGSYTFQTRDFGDVPAPGDNALRVNVILEADVI